MSGKHGWRRYVAYVLTFPLSGNVLTAALIYSPAPPSSQNGMQSEHLKDVSHTARGKGDCTEIERATCCYCGLLSLSLSLSRRRCLHSFRRLKRQCFQGRRRWRRRRENQLRPLQPTDEGFERVASAVQCGASLFFVFSCTPATDQERKKEERDRIIGRGRRLGGWGLNCRRSHRLIGLTMTINVNN